jgi:ribosomal protein S18 acetylase RimI-like enzyme
VIERSRGLTSATISLRPIGPADEAFLYDLYVSTRQREMALVDWSDAIKHAFLQQQFSAQQIHYRAHFTDASFQLVLVDDKPAGRLYVARWPHEIRVVDIALLSEYRGSGIGTALLQSLQNESKAANKPLTLHVERSNPALRLYTRLGFSQKDDLGAYLFLEWSPQLNTSSYSMPCSSEPTGTRNTSKEPSVG